MSQSWARRARSARRPSRSSMRTPSWTCALSRQGPRISVSLRCASASSTCRSEAISGSCWNVASRTSCSTRWSASPASTRPSGPSSGGRSSRWRTRRASWWQASSRSPHGVEALVLTASGGPFRGRNRGELADVTPEDALAHPTWNMGRKITIDSATLANKGLELIEAHFLFDLPYERVEIVVHPTSIVHALVRFRDGAALAHLGYPDMRVPISFALTYPDRAATLIPQLDLAS